MEVELDCRFYETRFESRNWHTRYRFAQTSTSGGVRVVGIIIPNKQRIIVFNIVL